MANTTEGHRRHNMVVAAEAWQPIDGVGSAQQESTCSTGGINSINVPSAAVGMIITANVDVSLGFRSTVAITASVWYLLAALTPSPALLIPRHGDVTANKSAVRFRAITTKGKINFLFIAGRGS